MAIQIIRNETSDIRELQKFLTKEEYKCIPPDGVNEVKLLWKKLKPPQGLPAVYRAFLDILRELGEK